MRTIKEFLSIPALIYMGAFHAIIRTPNSALNKGISFINFSVLNFWIVYFGLKPFLSWVLPIEAAAGIAIVMIITQITAMTNDFVETRKQREEIQEAIKRIEELKEKL